MPNRFVCDVLSEMRECVKTLRFDRFSGLIEEAQTMVNRMEAALHDQNDLNWARDELHDLKKKKKKLKEEVKELKRKVEHLKEKTGDNDGKDDEESEDV